MLHAVTSPFLCLLPASWRAAACAARSLLHTLPGAGGSQQQAQQQQQQQQQHVQRQQRQRQQSTCHTGSGSTLRRSRWATLQLQPGHHAGAGCRALATARVDRWRPPRTQALLHPARLTAAIARAASPQQLLSLVQQHQAALDYIHVAAACHRLADLRQLASDSPQHAAAQQQLLAVLEQQLLAPGLLQRCGLWALSNIVRALSLLQHSASPAYGATLAEFVTRLPAEQQPQSVSNVLHGLAWCGHAPSAAQLQQLVAAAVRVRHAATPQALFNSLWAVATISPQLPAEQLQRAVSVEQLQQLTAALAAKLDEAKPQEVSNSLLACARLNYHPAGLLAALAQPPHLERLLAVSNSQDLANAGVACGRLGHSVGSLAAALVCEAAQRVKAAPSSAGFTCQGLANLAWTAAVLDLQQCAEHVLALARACSRQWGSTEPAELESLRQLQQVHLWLLDCDRPGGGRGLLGALSQPQLQQCAEARAAQQAAARPSQLQRGVLAALQRLPAATWRQPPVLEAPTPDGAFTADIVAVTAAGTRVAIEVDGPSHFRRPDGGLTGPTLYRNRALAARGYTVLSVPHWEWSRLASGEQQARFLRALLAGL